MPPTLLPRFHDCRFQCLHFKHPTAAQMVGKRLIVNLAHLDRSCTQHTTPCTNELMLGQAPQTNHWTLVQPRGEIVKMRRRRRAVQYRRRLRQAITY